ncbi:hypothetical protein EIP86_010520 [Pleurotus ostreatoroseus]|nr:hypothetical protein EIP86_010520 [Pleurotus ostreatoroseus]
MAAALDSDAPRILLIDSYDSFTYNLASLCRRSIPNCTVHIIKNDALPFPTLATLLDHFSAVIVGPGPGSPTHDADIGVVKHIWHLPTASVLPVFGVCLGLQSLAVEFGGTLRRLRVVKHGQISHIAHDGSGLFKGVGRVEAVRYHSLHVALNGDEPLEPLAWADDGEENGRVLMAVRHTTLPFCAVQYHPESVCTEGGGAEVVRNFWRLAKNWTAVQGRRTRPWTPEVEALVGPAWPHVHLVRDPSPATPPARTVSTRTLHLAGVSIVALCELLGVKDNSTDFVLLDSAAEPGQFSIIGCLTATTPKITFRVGEPDVCIEAGGCRRTERVTSDIWTWLADYMRGRRAGGGIREVPFWGGFVGFLSYELGVHALSPNLHSRSSEHRGQHPDVALVFVERSIVVDVRTDTVYIQSLLEGDDPWLSEMTIQIRRSLLQTDLNGSDNKPKRGVSTTLPVAVIPDKERYISRVRQAQEFLFSGDSYELCLTAPTRITVPESFYGDVQGSSSWEQYKRLRKRNPAPHAAYLRLHPSTLISSSPERFLSFSRPPSSVCQLRPIKGTVRKAPGVTRAAAEQALVGSAKEVAENLMIVDLIRHDLHGVVGDDVAVRQFCGVEEYATVWQLVSVIEGRVARGSAVDGDLDLGWEVLRQSLPPGSMTGAPKKRSVEILHGLEDEDRNVYSGVFGYWCAGGGGDWSVTIRSCFKYEDAGADVKSSEWTLGAGGAITALSDPVGEWEEMVTKVESVLRAFEC